MVASAGNPVKVGPYKRIVDFYWPNLRRYALFKTEFHGSDWRVDVGDFGTFAGAGEANPANSVFYSQYVTQLSFALTDAFLADPLSLVKFTDRDGNELLDGSLNPALVSGALSITGAGTAFPLTVPAGTGWGNVPFASTGPSAPPPSQPDLLPADPFLGTMLYGWNPTQPAIVATDSIPADFADDGYVQAPLKFTTCAINISGGALGDYFGGDPTSNPKSVAIGSANRFTSEIASFNLSASASYDGTPMEIVGHAYSESYASIDPSLKVYTMYTLARFTAPRDSA